MKFRMSLLALFLMLLASCSWFYNDNSLPPVLLNPDAVSFTVTGNLTTNGAMPENFAELMNPRSALATVPEGKTIQYKVILLTGTSVSSITELSDVSSEITNASGVISYVIKYTGTDDTSRQYWLRGIAYYMDGSTEVDILASPDTQLETPVNLKGGVFTKDLEMRPATTGYGSASLTITLASTSMCDSVTISDTTHFQVAKSGTTVTITHNAAAADNPKVACGSYSVTVNFYKTYTVNSASTDVLIYQFDDVINIFNNLTTTVWVDNGNSPHLTTDSNGICTCTITEAMLKEFKSTNFYVTRFTSDGILSTNGIGTYLSPFNSLAYAINYINGIGNDTTTYTIHVKGPVSENRFENNFSVEINQNITVEVYDSIPGAKDGIYTVSKNAIIITIAENRTFTMDSNRQTVSVAGIPAHATKGLIVKGGSTGIRINKGKLIMYGGCITGSTQYGVLVLGSYSGKSYFEMYGGSIEENTATGVDVNNISGYSCALIKMSGNPYVYNNINSSNITKNVVLENGAKIEVNGAFGSNALIGVRLYTTPPAPALVPTITQPVPITIGYGYQTGGYNAGQLPGKYFRGDEYGVTEDSGLASPAGEAVLALSGGSLTRAPICDENVEITISKNFLTKGEFSTDAAKIYYTATTLQEGVRVEIPSEDITYTTTVSWHGGALTTSYYNSGTNYVQLKKNEVALPGDYEINVTAVYDGNTYYADFIVKVYNVILPAEYKMVPGAKFTSSSTLCNGIATLQSAIFLGGRNLTIPDLVVSDHEVTQKEYTEYMTWVGIPESMSYHPSTYNDNLPADYVSWYEAIIYCNLKSLADGLTPVYYLADSSGNEVANGRSVAGWMDNPYLKIKKYEGKYYYSDYSGGNTYLDYNSSGDTNGGIRYDETADGWRLPTVAEWEYLARETNLTNNGQYRYSGSETSAPVAVTGTDSCQEVKSKDPNILGLYDMTGNLCEMCWDVYGTINTSTPITGPSTYEESYPKHISRGGCYNGDTDWLKNNDNSNHDAAPGEHSSQIGFRIVRTVK